MNAYTKIQLQENQKYLELLSQSFPNITTAVGEVVNLKAILNLPKGTEHFLTDIHGEHEAFNHVMQNASGTIKRKVHQELGNTIAFEELEELSTLIYYPEEKIDLIKRERNQESMDNWYKLTIYRLVTVCRAAASKYTRSKVRKALPKDFAYIMEELLQEDEHRFNKKEYYNEIIASLVKLDRAQHFIVEISGVIKRLTIDHLHIIGDVYDRGPGPDVVMDTLMQHHSLDIQWGNHDILWMGAAAGNPSCIANTVRIALRYANMDVIEDGYGINLVPLASFSNRVYRDDPCLDFIPKITEEQHTSDQEIALMAKMHKAIAIIQFKLEETLIDKHPEYHMEKRQLLRCIDFENSTVTVEGVVYPLNDSNFPTLDPNNPYTLTEEEAQVVDRLVYAFLHSERLQKHIHFMYAKGSMYKVFNDNLLFHACVLLNNDGSFKTIRLCGNDYSGKLLMDKFDQMAREAYFGNTNSDHTESDILWFLWCHEDSPLFGKDKMATFERYFIDDKTPHKEHHAPFYILIDDDDILAKKILVEFGVDPEEGHLINGHIPVKTISGESPIRAKGKQLVIDGGFARAYQKTTGIAGYTLVYNSYGLILISHDPFESVEKAIADGVDINSTLSVVEKSTERKRVRDTDNGKALMSQVEDLEMLISAYRKGIIKEKLF
ncbi:fructose-bisphosphatase class III [Acetobacterium paludosum]|uniref:Fructose-1,6-bisphosphatase class 3 n=1 Tax=Acetobacterium paludosum TaxID=52693 RepID=A0A923HUU2_9FIRM|nr:fructose-1,6-bisphosphatase [Acetobacterium paludosum]MBC3888107.1 fructose-bisphosphatase class III [Acetobacterium paludosum]